MARVFWMPVVLWVWGGGEFYRAGGVLWVWGLLWAWGGPVGLKGFCGAEGVSMGLGWGFCGAGQGKVL